MPRTVLAAILVVAATASAFAVDAPAATNVSSTGSEVGAPAAGQPSAAIPASEDILRKCADVYKKAKTYYEEARLSMAVESGEERKEEHIAAVTAYRKDGNIVKIDLSGSVNAVLYFSGDLAVFYDKARNAYAKKTGQNLGEFVADMEDLALELTPAGDDFCAAVTARAMLVSAPKPVDFEGRKAYQIAVVKPGGENDSLYFDPTTGLLVGVETVFAAGENGGQGAVRYRKVIDRMLIDEFPKGPDGREIDALSFKLPEGAKPAREFEGESQEAGGQPENMPTTDAKL